MYEYDECANANARATNVCVSPLYMCDHKSPMISSTPIRIIIINAAVDAATAVAATAVAATPPLINGDVNQMEFPVTAIIQVEARKKKKTAQRETERKGER